MVEDIHEYHEEQSFLDSSTDGQRPTGDEHNSIGMNNDSDM